MERKRKVIYFNELLEQELLEWAEATNNFSKYMKNLIRADMEKERTGLDPKLIDWIEKRIGNLHHIPDTTKMITKKTIDFSFIKEV